MHAVPFLVWTLQRATLHGLPLVLELPGGAAFGAAPATRPTCGSAAAPVSTCAAAQPLATPRPATVTATAFTASKPSTTLATTDASTISSAALAPACTTALAPTALASSVSAHSNAPGRAATPNPAGRSAAEPAASLCAAAPAAALSSPLLMPSGLPKRLLCRCRPHMPGLRCRVRRVRWQFGLQLLKLPTHSPHPRRR